MLCHKNITLKNGSFVILFKCGSNIALSKPGMWVEKCSNSGFRADFHGATGGAAQSVETFIDTTLRHVFFHLH